MASGYMVWHAMPCPAYCRISKTRQRPCRVLEISDQVRTVLGQSAAECSITPAPAHSEGGDSATSVAARRACKVSIQLQHE